MDWKLSDITMPILQWYILPGLNFIGINIILPIAIIKPVSLASFKTFGNVLSLVVIALVIGFIMDSLKIYQFTFGYKDRKDIFFHKIAKALDIEVTEAISVFENIRDFSQVKGITSKALATEHSR